MFERSTPQNEIKTSIMLNIVTYNKRTSFIRTTVSDVIIRYDIIITVHSYNVVSKQRRYSIYCTAFDEHNTKQQNDEG